MDEFWREASWVAFFSLVPSRWDKEGQQGPKGGGGEQGEEMPSAGLTWGPWAFGSRWAVEMSAPAVCLCSSRVSAGSLWAQERGHQQKQSLLGFPTRCGLRHEHGFWSQRFDSQLCHILAVEYWAKHNHAEPQFPLLQTK